MMNQNVIEGDKINIFSLTDLLLSKVKAILLFSLILSIFLNTLIYLFYDTEVETSFTVKSIGPIEEAKYNLINFLQPDPSVDLNTSRVNITPEFLINEFIATFEVKQNLKEAINQAFISNINNIEVIDESTSILIDKIIMSFEIKLDNKAQVSNTINEPKQYIISFLSNSPDISDKIIQKLQNYGNNHVNNSLKIYIEEIYEKLNIEREHKRKLIEREINNLIYEHRLTIAQKIQYLNDHLLIAEEIGLENQFGNDIMMFETNSDLDTAEYQNFPQYLRGYKALAKEISLMEQQLKIKDYSINIKEMPRLKADLKDLDDAFYLNALKDAIKESPIHSNQFKSVSDITLINMETISPSILTLIIFTTMLSLFIVSIAVVFFTFYRAYKTST